MLKGNVMVGQSGGPTSVINSSLAGVYKAAKDHGCEVVYGMRNGIEGLLNGKYVDLSEHIQSDLDIELLIRTPSSFLGSCRYKLPAPEDAPEIYEKLFKILDSLNVKYFLYIGGNDSMDTIMRLSQYAEMVNSDIKFMGVPKTIDNDLAITDHTPGYGSAAKYIAATMKEIICDAKIYDLESITIVEIMGRNAGWLTAASVLAKSEDCPGPDLIYLPESVFDLDDFVEKVKEVKAKKPTVVIAVSEGIRLSDGRYVCEAAGKDMVTDTFGHKYLGGTGLFLSNYISQKLGVKSRAIEFSTLQRCASHMVSRCDINEAQAIGAEAFLAAKNGETGKMMVFRRVSNAPYSVVASLCDINLIANKEKCVPQEWITNDGTYVSEEFEKYARPLILGEVDPFIVDGLPRHLHID